MKISVITVCFNSEATVADTLASVRAQRLPPGVEVEHIVVDGGSTDATMDLVRAAPGIRFVSERDRGLYDAINKGIRLATGEVVGILNSDDVFDGEDALAAVAEGFRAHPEADALYADIRFVRGDSDETTRYYSSRRWRPWMHNWGFMPAHPTVYVKKAVFERFGAYKLGYDISADFEWMTRVLCRSQVKAHYLPRCLVTMRLGGKSTAGLRALLRLNRENCRANRENGYFSILPMMLPKYLFKIWGYVFRRRT